MKTTDINRDRGQFSLLRRMTPNKAKHSDYKMNLFFAPYPRKVAFTTHCISMFYNK